MSPTPYRKTHVLDINIDDENSVGGRDITVSVDGLEMVNIEVGNACTIRTDEAGVDDLRDALHRALVALEDIRYDNTQRMLGNIAEDEMARAGVDAREQQKAERMMKGTATPTVDLYDNCYNPDDPVNW